MPVISGVKTDAISIGQSTTNTNNFQVSTDSVGGLTIARGSDGSLGDILTVNADNGVSLGQPVFSVTRTGSNQTVTNSTPTKVQLNTEDYDSNSFFDSTTNYRFQPTVAGYYQFNGGIQLGTSAITQGVAYLHKNGTLFKTGMNVAGATQTAVVSSLIYLNGSSDYVELWGLVTATTPIFIGGTTVTYLNGFLARAA